MNALRSIVVGLDFTPASRAALNVTLDIAEHDHYGRGIAAYAKQHHADLLVLGTQGPVSYTHLTLPTNREV